MAPHAFQTTLGNLAGVALITGAASGIGRQVAKGFARAGARLVLADIDEEGLAETVKQCNIAATDVWAVKMDLADGPSIERTLRQIPARFGRLDFAVSCAAILGRQEFALVEHPQEDWDKVMNINLRGQVYLLREEIRLMLENAPLPTGLESEGRVNKQRGSIVTFTSYRGKHGFPLRIPYSTSKHAIIGLSTSAAVGYAEQGVRINQVSPGFIDTPMANGTVVDEDAINAWIKSAIPLNRKGKPQEIADLCLFLCSERASYMVGETINCDGGMSAL